MNWTFELRNFFGRHGIDHFKILVPKSDFRRIVLELQLEYPDFKVTSYDPIKINGVEILCEEAFQKSQWVDNG